MVGSVPITSRMPPMPLPGFLWYILERLPMPRPALEKPNYPLAHRGGIWYVDWADLGRSRAVWRVVKYRCGRGAGFRETRCSLHTGGRGVPPAQRGMGFFVIRQRYQVTGVDESQKTAVSM